VAERVCYIHVGPHKTGTTSIQWFLQENRAELLRLGYFVPESETTHGAHHALVGKLCGQELQAEQQSVAAKFAQALDKTPAQIVVLSSEALEGGLRNRDYAKTFFSRIRELNLEPKLILFPRNQPQWINSSYSSMIKGFRRSESFEAFASGVTQLPTAKFSRWIELADVYAAELIAVPFTSETVTRGVVPAFLKSIGISASEFRDAQIRRNEAVGPFTVSVARSVLRLICETGKQLKWLQARRCKAKLAAYLREKGLADSGYCGLTTALARRIEEQLKSDNDAFAERIWSKPWAEIFGADVSEEFTPNDFEMRRPGWSTARRLRRTICEMTVAAEEILRDPALAVEASWNDLRRWTGWAPKNEHLGAFQPTNEHR
jgi:hypothetical protein